MGMGDSAIPPSLLTHGAITALVKMHKDTVGDSFCKVDTNCSNDTCEDSPGSYNHVHDSCGMSKAARSIYRIPTLSSEGQRRTLRDMLSFTFASPDLLRAVRAHRPLRRLGSALRVGKDGATGNYDMSFRTESIDDFWTHSWRGSAVLKALVLLLHYNLLAAAVASTVVALAVGALAANGHLPADGGSAAWALGAGAGTFLAVAAFWQSRKRIFLDKACIEQNDPERKQQGVACIGAFLYCSQKMVVLWDPSYATRLWCIFEMAAFAWANDRNVTDRIVVRPLVFGAVFPGLLMTALLAMILTGLLHTLEYPASFATLGPVLCAASYLPCVHLLRRFDRDMQTLMDQLKEFTVARAECFCCSAEHKDPETGAKISCDREVIHACIIAWFGCLEEFEGFVQSDLAIIFRRSLGRFSVPYGWIVASHLPVLWAHAAFAATPLLAGEWLKAATICVEGLSLWLFASPLVAAGIIRVAGCFQQCRALPAEDAARTLLAGLLSFVPVLLVHGALYLAKSCADSVEGEFQAVLAYACSVGAASGAAYRWG